MEYLKLKNQIIAVYRSCEAFLVVCHRCLQGNYTCCDPLGYFAQTHTEMTSPDRSLQSSEVKQFITSKQT